jgi:hypothetical protein
MVFPAILNSGCAPDWHRCLRSIKTPVRTWPTIVDSIFVTNIDLGKVLHEMAQSILVSEHHLPTSLRMKGFLTLLLPGVVSFFWVADSSARAEMLHFSWAPDPVVLRADGPGSGAVIFSHEHANLNLTDQGGTWTGIASELRTVSSASSGHPDVFINRPYSLTLTITDDHHHALVPPITFSGVLNGTLSHNSAQLSNTFTSFQAQTFFDGNLIVTIGPYTPPGHPGHDREGSIGTEVVVKGPLPPPVSELPEPSTMALLSLGGVLLGYTAWRKRNTRRRAPVM